MSLLQYEQAFSKLNMNQSGGQKSPHKVAMLLAVMELFEKNRLNSNQIFYNEVLKQEFEKAFNELAQEGDKCNAFLPFFHLRSEGFWYHHLKLGQQESYNRHATASGHGTIEKHIAYVELDEELFELLFYQVTRNVLKQALFNNLTQDRIIELLQVGNGWHWLETEAIVQDYFAMLNKELAGQSYNKSKHREALVPKLKERSKGSIEFKHQNISAVLIELGQPYISGYKPAFNYQGQLKNVVLAHLAAHQEQLDTILGQAEYTPEPKVAESIKDWHAILDADKPEFSTQIQEAPRQYLARKTNFVQREALNRALGEQGESFVVEFEKQRLTSAGHEDLVKEVKWVSKENGDGLGYDVRSINIENDQELHIEVKTTQSGRFQPFYISANEVAYSKDCKQQYSLYRVYDFKKNTRIFRLDGDISQHVHLTAQNYRAGFN